MVLLTAQGAVCRSGESRQQGLGAAAGHVDYAIRRKRATNDRLWLAFSFLCGS